VFFILQVQNREYALVLEVEEEKGLDYALCLAREVAEEGCPVVVARSVRRIPAAWGQCGGNGGRNNGSMVGQAPAPPAVRQRLMRHWGLEPLQ
jgi:hypothetical protein